MSKTIEPIPILMTVTKSGCNSPDRFISLPRIEAPEFESIPIAEATDPTL
jgi:hypothetical protein